MSEERSIIHLAAHKCRKSQEWTKKRFAEGWKNECISLYENVRRNGAMMQFRNKFGKLLQIKKMN